MKIFVEIKLFLLINNSTKRINLEKYKLHELGESFLDNDHINLKLLKKRVELCFDLRTAVEEAGFDSFKIIKDQIPLTFIIFFKDNSYEIRNVKLKEVSIINSLIELISNLIIFK